MRSHPFSVRLLAPRWGSALAPLALAALVLAGCGVSTGASPAVGSTHTPSSSVNAMPCNGPTGSVNAAGMPALVLTPTATNGQAHVGDLIQVRVPVTNHWDFNAGLSGLAPLQPAAVRDLTANVCFWNFRGQSAQDVKLSFSEGALCAAGTPCPLYLRQVTFTVHIVKA